MGVHSINFSLGVHPSTLDSMGECKVLAPSALANNSPLDGVVYTGEHRWASDSMDGRSGDDLELLLCSQKRKKHRYCNARGITTAIDGQNESWMINFQCAEIIIYKVVKCTLLF